MRSVSFNFFFLYILSLSIIGLLIVNVYKFESLLYLFKLLYAVVIVMKLEDLGIFVKNKKSLYNTR